MKNTPAPHSTGLNGSLLNLTLAAFLSIAVGWLLFIGQDFLMPIIAAFIFVFIFIEIDRAFTQISIIAKLPTWLRKTLLYIGFLAVLAALVSLFTVTIQELIQKSETYQTNFIALVNQITDQVGAERLPDWGKLRDRALNNINLQAWLGWVAGQVSAASGVTFLVIIYIAFMLGERDGFSHKFAAAFPNPTQANRVQQLMDAITLKVGQYLGAKTLVNAILGAVSYVIMLAFGLDYAAFWALLIALFNYIPYIGSVFALLLPVLLSVVQFVSWPWSLGLFIALLAAQMVMGNIVEPKLVGRKVNQSAVVVLIALSFWSALWGLPGAILSVPMTSILGIILAEFPATRPLAVLMAEDVGETKPSKLN